jgi:hypothetical protein
MRVRRIAAAAALSVIVAVGLAVAPHAQAPANEAEFDKLMKTVGATIASLRKNLEAQNAEAAAADAARMIDLQKQNAAFWTGRKDKEAVGWATEAAGHAGDIAKAIAAKNMTSANEHAKLIMANCQSCHTKNRDKAADGTFMIKKQ